MLRIDETSKTLVAPPAGGLVTEVNPDREEMLALVSSSWEAFAGELGQPSLRFVGQGQVPGLDLLAFDEQAGRAVVVGVSVRRRRRPADRRPQRRRRGRGDGRRLAGRRA